MTFRVFLTVTLTGVFALDALAQVQVSKQQETDFLSRFEAACSAAKESIADKISAQILDGVERTDEFSSDYKAHLISWLGTREFMMSLAVTEPSREDIDEYMQPQTNGEEGASYCLRERPVRHLVITTKMFKDQPPADVRVFRAALT